MITRFLPILLFSFICASVAEKPCCTNINALHNKKCLDGSNFSSALPCVGGYVMLIEKNSDENVLNDNILVESAGQYCLTRKNSTGEEVYLVCLYEDAFEETVIRINTVLGFISVVFMVLTIIVYLAVPNILDLQGICMVQSLVGLAVSFLVLGINQVTLYKDNITCHLLAYVTYFAFLYAFFWLHILSFHIWRTTVNPKILNFTNRWLLIYNIVGTLGPICLSLFLLCAHHSELQFFNNIKPGIAEATCWFKSIRETLIYFYGPIIVLILANIIFYVWTILAIWGQMNRSDIKKTKILKYRLKLCIKLFFIMGITWTFEVISAILENYGENSLRILWVITDILNGIQGILIFLIMVVFRKRVIRELANRKICNIQLPSKWKRIEDEECDELDEELNLPTVPNS